MADYRLLTSNIEIEADADGNLKDSRQYFIANYGTNKDNTKRYFQNHPNITVKMLRNLASITTVFNRNNNSVSPLDISVYKNETAETREETIFLLNSDNIQSDINLIIKLDAAISYGDVTVTIDYDISDPLSWDDKTSYSPSKFIVKLEIDGEEKTLTSDEIKSIKFSVNKPGDVDINETTGVFKLKTTNDSLDALRYFTITVEVTSIYGDIKGSDVRPIVLKYVDMITNTYNLDGEIYYASASSAGESISPNVILSLTHYIEYANGYTEQIECNTNDYKIIYDYKIDPPVSYCTINKDTGVITWEEMPTYETTSRIIEILTDITVMTKTGSTVLITMHRNPSASQDKKEIDHYEYGEITVTCEYKDKIPNTGGTISPNYSISLEYTIYYTDGTDSGLIKNGYPSNVILRNRQEYTCDDLPAPDMIDTKTGNITISEANTSTNEKQFLVKLQVTLLYKDGTSDMYGYAETYCYQEGADVIQYEYSNLMVVRFTYPFLIVPINCEGVSGLKPTFQYRYDVLKYVNGVKTGSIETKDTGATVKYRFVPTSYSNVNNTINENTGELSIYPIVESADSIKVIGTVYATVSIGDLPDKEASYEIEQYGHDIDITIVGPYVTLSYNNGEPIPAIVNSPLIYIPDIEYYYTKTVKKVCGTEKVISNETFNNIDHADKFTVSYSPGGGFGTLNKTTGRFVYSPGTGMNNTTTSERLVNKITATVTIKENDASESATYEFKQTGQDEITYVYETPLVLTLDYTNPGITGGTISPTIKVSQTYKVYTNGLLTGEDTITYTNVDDLIANVSAINFNTDVASSIATVDNTTGKVTFTSNSTKTTDRNVTVTLSFTLNDKFGTGSQTITQPKDSIKQTNTIYLNITDISLTYPVADYKGLSTSAPSLSWSLKYYAQHTWTSGAVTNGDEFEVYKADKTNITIKYSTLSTLCTIDENTGIITWNSINMGYSNNEANITVNITSHGKTANKTVPAYLGYQEPIVVTPVYRPVFVQWVE